MRKGFFPAREMKGIAAIRSRRVNPAVNKKQKRLALFAVYCIEISFLFLYVVFDPRDPHF